MSGTDLAVIISIVVGYVAGIFAVVRYLGSRIEDRLDRLEDRVARLEDRVDHLADVVNDVKVIVARIDERLGHVEHNR